MQSASLDVRLGASGRGQRLLFWTHALPLLLVMLLDYPPALLLAAAGGLGASWAVLRRHPAFGHGGRALRHWNWQPGRGWSVDGGTVSQLRLYQGFGGGLLLVVVHRGAGQRPARRLLFGDELEAEANRRFRRQLRCSPATGQPPVP